MLGGGLDRSTLVQQWVSRLCLLALHVLGNFLHVLVVSVYFTVQNGKLVERARKKLRSG